MLKRFGRKLLLNWLADMGYKMKIGIVSIPEAHIKLPKPAVIDVALKDQIDEKMYEELLKLMKTDKFLYENTDEFAYHKYAIIKCCKRTFKLDFE